jgi:exonuclease III
MPKDGTFCNAEVWNCSIHRAISIVLSYPARLVTWNLNVRRGRLPDQLTAIAARAPDILALQEVTLSSVALLGAQLPILGLSHVLDSFTVAPKWAAKGPRRYGLLLASRVEPAARLNRTVGQL